MEPKVAVATNTPQPQIKEDQLRNTDSGRIIKETSRKSKSFQRQSRSQGSETPKMTFMTQRSTLSGEKNEEVADSQIKYVGCRKDYINEI